MGIFYSCLMAADVVRNPHRPKEAGGSIPGIKLCLDLLGHALVKDGVVQTVRLEGEQGAHGEADAAAHTGSGKR